MSPNVNSERSYHPPVSRTAPTPLLSRGIVYSVAPSGHRAAYVALLSRLFSLDPVVEPMSYSVRRRLIAADRLLFATLDDDMFGFARVAIARSALGRPTAALFLRAKKCFETSRWYYSAKRRAFAALRRLPGSTIATITPFEVAPHYAEVANVGVCDPQYWDLCVDGEVCQQSPTVLSKAVKEKAQGRAVCCALGTLGESKGLGFLAHLLETNQDLQNRVLFVCAGQVPSATQPLADRLGQAGALVIPRYLTDTELGSLYAISDAIWACYAPEYDQASGVFGRALQLGVVPVVRKGSVIEKFANHNLIETVRLDYGRDEAYLQFDSFINSLARRSSGQSNTCKPSAWHAHFVAIIGAGMLGPRSGDLGNYKERDTKA